MNVLIFLVAAVAALYIYAAGMPLSPQHEHVRKPIRAMLAVVGIVLSLGLALTGLVNLLGGDCA